MKLYIFDEQRQNITDSMPISRMDTEVTSKIVNFIENHNILSEHKRLVLADNALIIDNDGVREIKFHNEQ